MIKYTGPNYPGMQEIESKSDPCSNCKNGPIPRRLCTGCRDFAYACKLHNIDPAALDAVNAGADMAESKSDPCKGCKNGPKPGSWCKGCSNFARACELHVIDPSTLNTVNTDMTRTPLPDTESKPCVYSEEQKEVIKQHLDFFCRIINFALRNNMPFDASKVAFLQSILDNIVKTSKSQNLAETALNYYESTSID